MTKRTLDEVVERVRVIAERSAALDREERECVSYVLQRFIEDRKREGLEVRA
jgi:hypothetical protein